MLSRRTIIYSSVILAILCAPTARARGRSSRKSSQKSAATWSTAQVNVKTEEPYFSQNGYVVLSYTVTNLSSTDIEIRFSDEPDYAFPPIESDRVYLRLLRPPSYEQVKPKDKFVHFETNLLPRDMPINFLIVIGTPGHNDSSWLSLNTEQDRLRAAIKKELGNVSSIDIFIPSRHIRISFPIPPT